MDMQIDAEQTISIRQLVDVPMPNLLPFAPAPRQHIAYFPCGSEIYAQGEEAKCLYQVEFGAVRLHRLLADGRRQISAFQLAGDVFGFEADNTHHFFAEAIEATGLRIYRCAQGHDTSKILFPMALTALTRAQEHLLVLGRQNAIERVAVFLADMARRQGGLKHVDLPMSRTDIGDYLGLTIETVSRVLSKLKAMGIIELTSMRSIEICDWDALLLTGE